MIISLHLPKTAGSSFRFALATHFGRALLLDYADPPIMSVPAYERNRGALKASIRNGNRGRPGIECIHGHFLPLKYLLLGARQEVTFITWMRHPVERMVSHYRYWRRIYDPRKAQGLQQTVVEQAWSLERFCLGPELRNFYAQFLWGFPLEQFAFVGITEFYEEDLAYFSREYLGTTLDLHRENVGHRAGTRYEIDPGLRAQVERHHDWDMELYERALGKRLKRLGARPRVQPAA
jgi:hypothetical protein